MWSGIVLLVHMVGASLKVRGHVEEVSRAPAGAKAFEWQQEIGLNQARRTGEVAVLDGLFDFALEDGDAAASNGHPNGIMLAATTDKVAVRESL